MTHSRSQIRIRCGEMLCRAIAAGVIALGLVATDRVSATVVDTQKQRLRITVVTRDLDHPWSLAFLPDGRMLVTERPGRLRLVSASGKLDPQPLRGLPESLVARGQGGLLDVTLHPDLAGIQAYVAENHPGAAFRVIPDTGHWVQYEAAAAFNSLLFDVLDRKPL